MATSPALIATRQAVVAQLMLRPNIAAWTDFPPADPLALQVSYSWPGDTVQRRVIWTQGGTATLGIHALRAGRKTRDETTTFQIVCQVERPGGTALDAELAVMALGAEVESMFADFYPGSALSNAFTAAGAYVSWLTGYDLVTGVTDDGWGSTLTFTAQYSARLT